MNTILEASKLRKIEDEISSTSKGSINISISPSSVAITPNIEKYFEENSKKFRRETPSSEVMKNRLSKIISDRLKFYFQKSEKHPQNVTLSKTWDLNLEVSKAKIDYLDGYLVFVCIVENKEDDKKWLVYFDAKSDSSKNIDPRYIDLETSFFDIDSFPMEAIVKTPQEVYGRAVEMTKKKFEDSIKNVKELDIF